MLNNKRNFILGFLLILIVLLVIIFLPKEKKDKIVSLETETKPNLQQKPSNKDNISISEKLNQRQLKVSDENIKVYSEDPVVDSLISITLFAECIDYIKPIESLGMMTRTKKEYSKTQQKYLDKYHQYCDELQKKQPQYFEKDIFSSILDLKKKHATNKLGKLIIRSFSDYGDIDIQESLRLIKQGHPDLMILGYKLLGKKYNEKVLIPQMKQFLGSNHTKYVDSISYFGQLQYACNHGADCGKNSGFLIGLCRSNEYYCLDSFKEIVDTRMSQGQLKDILLAEQFFTNLYDF